MMLPTFMSWSLPLLPLEDDCCFGRQGVWPGRRVGEKNAVICTGWPFSFHISIDDTSAISVYCSIVT